MKKGISLIVLVITIIVMIIIAGAIIMSLSTTNVMDQANDAVSASNKAEVRSIGATVLASNLYVLSTEDNTTYVEATTAQIQAALTAQISGAYTAYYDPATKTITYTETATGATFE